MVKYEIILCWVFFISYVVRGQMISNTSARSVGLASSVATLDDITVLQMNPSVLTDLHSMQIGLQNVSFITSVGIEKNEVMLAVPIQKGGVGVFLQKTGNDVYRILNSGVSYAIRLSNSLRLGVCLGDKNTAIKNYGSRNLLDVSIAIQGKLTDKITYGISVQSLNVNGIKEQNVNPTYVFVGVKYTALTPTWSLYTEIEKSVITPIRMKIACEYFISPSISFRTGVMTSSYQISGGMGCLVKKRVKIDIGSSWQPILGFSTQVGIVFSRKPK